MCITGDDMKTISVRIDEKLLNEALKRVKKGEFSSLSELIKEVLRKFLSVSKYPWENREELRNYLKGRKLAKSGEIIDSVRGEDEL